jgi:hypothetical protein
MLTVDEVAVMIEACNKSGDRGDLSYRAGARTGSEPILLLCVIDDLLSSNALRLDRRDRTLEPTSYGRQALREALVVLEDLVKTGTIFRYQ